MHQCIQIDRLKLGRSIEAARIVQTLRDECLHRIEIGLHLPAQCLAVDLLRAQAQAGDGRLQIVRDRREDSGPFSDMFANALLHLVEGRCCQRDLRRTVCFEGRSVGVFAERMCCFGKT